MLDRFSHNLAQLIDDRVVTIEPRYASRLLVAHLKDCFIAHLVMQPFLEQSSGARVGARVVGV